MPYDEAGLVCSAVKLTEKADEAGARSRVDFALYGTISPRDGIDEIQGIVDAGACAFKFSTFETHPERFPRISPPLMYEACQVIASSGLAVGVHNEHQETVAYFTDHVRASGDTSPASHGRSRPPISELLAINEIYEIGAATGCRVHVVHCSLGRGFDICEQYRRQGYPVSIETCIHYLMLNEDDVIRQGGLCKVNPPIRGPREQNRLWRYLERDAIDFVSTDHVAWSLDRKNKPVMAENSSGMPGMESLCALLFKGCMERGLDLRVIPRVLSRRPARHFCLHGRKGELQEGYDADVVVVEPGDFQLDCRRFQTVVKWSPFDGTRLPVRIRATYNRGRQVWDGETVMASPGDGRFQRAVPTDTAQRQDGSLTPALGS